MQSKLHLGWCVCTNVTTDDAQPGNHWSGALPSTEECTDLLEMLPSTEECTDLLTSVTEVGVGRETGPSVIAVGTPLSITSLCDEEGLGEAELITLRLQYFFPHSPPLPLKSRRFRPTGFWLTLA
jgi:hypothetical protein